MTERYTATLESAVTAHDEIVKAWRWAKNFLARNGGALVIEIRKSTRSLEQNAMLWSILSDLAEQVRWPVNGAMRFLEAEEWKDILTAGLKREQQMAAGIDGGFVMLGQRTSKMTKAELSDLIELAWAFGAQHEAKWKRTSLGRNVPEGATA